MNKATLVKRMSGFAGDARLFRLDPPMQYKHWDDDDETRTAEHVIVSAVVAPFTGPETYIFESDDEGRIEDYMELPGSLRGTLSHTEALSGAGYEIAGASA